MTTRRLFTHTQRTDIDAKELSKLWAVLYIRRTLLAEPQNSCISPHGTDRQKLWCSGNGSGASDAVALPGVHAERPLAEVGSVLTVLMGFCGFSHAGLGFCGGNVAARLLAAMTTDRSLMQTFKEIHIRWWSTGGER